MQIYSLIRHLLTTAAVVTLCSQSFGQKTGDAPGIVTTYCSGCHGVRGNAELPFIPKLAAINTAYAEKRLREFRQPDTPSVDELFEHMRKGSATRTEEASPTRQARIHMQGVAHAVKPEVLQQALRWYSAQAPTPGRPANKVLVQQGEKLFVHGVGDQSVTACISCHGQAAEGKGTAPRLAGQNAGYIESQLARFRKGDHKNAPEMTMVARALNADQARAAAAYLQSR